MDYRFEEGSSPVLALKRSHSMKRKAMARENKRKEMKLDVDENVVVFEDLGADYLEEILRLSESSDGCWPGVLPQPQEASSGSSPKEVSSSSAFWFFPVAKASRVCQKAERAASEHAGRNYSRVWRRISDPFVGWGDKAKQDMSV
ncbi:hypothetical protein L1987_36207 [Smallanthus sonchifolius]|uniref:Uncharacterized protein n=1 Tax=Smallanthus sonchifolius TaxID=185202 RepID=A0ACB9HFB9_9ASTR|nr:hypothetical protein L1987_36207 [Smallanthus sonchifolius]